MCTLVALPQRTATPKVRVINGLGSTTTTTTTNQIPAPLSNHHHFQVDFMIITIIITLVIQHSATP